MAKKDVEEYFNQVADQYKEMLENIRDLEQDVANNLTDTDLLERLKETTAPVKNNYMTLSYIMYLLNKPTRKNKEKGYERRNQKLLKSIDKSCTKEGILESNSQTISQVKNILQ